MSGELQGWKQARDALIPPYHQLIYQSVHEEPSPQSGDKDNGLRTEWSINLSNVTHQSKEPPAWSRGLGLGLVLSLKKNRK